MSESHFSIRKGMLLIAFGVGLYCVLQNLGAVAEGVDRFWGIVYPIVLGLCMAFVLNVLMSALERLIGKAFSRCRHRPGPKPMRAIALILTLLAAVALIALVMIVIIPRLSEVIAMFISVLPQSANELSELLGNFLARIGIAPESIQNLQATINQLSVQILDWIKQESATIATFAVDMTASLVSTLTDFIFALIIALYVLLGKERIGRFANALCVRFLPEKACVQVLRLSKLSYATFTAFVRGQFLEAIILGALCFVGMLIFRFPYAGVISMLIGVTALIPIIGAWIGGVIAALLVLTVNPLQALLLIVFIVVLQQLEGDLIYPKVVGSTIGLPGVLVISAVLIGQGLLGVFGILLFVPLTAVLFTVLKEVIYSRHAPEKPEEAAPQDPAPAPQKRESAPRKRAPAKPRR